MTFLPPFSGSPQYLAFVAALLFVGTVGAQVPVERANGEAAAELLRPEFQIGNTYRFVVRTELKSQLPSGGPSEAVIEQQARFDARVRVDGKKGIVLRGRTERLDLRLQSGGRVLSYESLKPDDKSSVLGLHLQTMLNRSVDLTLSEKLKIHSAIEGGPESAVPPLEGIPTFGPEELQQIIALIPQGFPKGKVTVGQQWTSEGSRVIGDAGTVQFTMIYRFTGPINFEENRCLGIEFNGQVSGELPLPQEKTDPAAPVVTEEPSFAQVQSGRITGRIYFDPLDRMVRMIEQSVDLLLTLPGGAGAAPQQIPVNEVSTLRLLHVVPTP
ncbi:MAG: hypothetical protein KA250_13015 [Verrucomicrobiales bacterium]|nr:hypothetical protein [Verrucomicrobiales bacterium]MBP9222453.1 hypothetical protein [Verrucomicrobiales bacterium]HQZ28872.1 hypothetical protein [Verrucomicrobiales bacterium]